MQNLYETEAVDMIDIVDTLYITGTDENVISTAYLSDYLSRGELNSVRRTVQTLQQKLNMSVPAMDRVLQFDKINRLTAFETKMYCIALDTAVLEYGWVYGHLNRHALRVIRDMQKYYKGKDVKPSSVVGRSLKETIANRHLIEANRVVNEVENALIRKDNIKQIQQALNATVVKSGTTWGKSTMFTEGTRVTNEAVKQTLDETELKFYTVHVQDAKVCGVCESVALAQQADPVPVRDMEVGVNAPPFHVNCRCKIDFVEESTDDTSYDNR